METVSTTGFRPVPALYRRKGGPPVNRGSSDPPLLTES